MGEFKFEFGRNQISKISRKKMIEELERVARHFNYVDFKQDDFDKVAEINHYTVYREFGSWEKALNFIQDYLKKKNIEFKITSRRSSYQALEIFNEMERIWLNLGHRPSRGEWVASQPNISYDTIYRYFGGWRNACLKFIEYKSGEKIDLKEEIQTKKDISLSKTNLSEKKIKIEIDKKRAIPLNMRIRVMSRDNFRCVFCGKTPAVDIGTKLHIDHILPFSKGGTNNLDNLQTLCEACNLGKSDSEIVKKI